MGLVSYIDRELAPGRRRLEARWQHFGASANCHKFLVNRMGSTGSTWLARLLNSHPDVFCSHEGVVSRVHPAREYGEDAILRFIDSLHAETGHGAYRAIGDVGSIWMNHACTLPCFTTAMLIRHPARILYTRLQVFPEDQSFSRIPEGLARMLQAVWGIDLYAHKPIDQIFLNDLAVFASQVWAIGKVNLWMRIEDMMDVHQCQRAFEQLTGVHYAPSLIMNASHNRVNVRTNPRLGIRDIVGRFSRRQRNWYGELLADAAGSFGYSLWSDELMVPRLEDALGDREDFNEEEKAG